MSFKNKSNDFRSGYFIITLFIEEIASIYTHTRLNRCYSAASGLVGSALAEWRQ